MNNKGFTLVEILAVLVILSVLAVLSIGLINNNLLNSKKVFYNKQVVSIKEAAGNWVFNNIEEIENNKCNYIKVSLNELMSQGYLAEDFENPNTKKPFDKNLLVIVKKTNKSYKYIFELDKEFDIDEYTCETAGYPSLEYSFDGGYHIGDGRELCVTGSDNYSGFEKLEIELFKNGVLSKSEKTNRDTYCMDLLGDTLYDVYAKVTSRNGNEQINNPEDERGFHYQKYKFINNIEIKGSTPSGTLTKSNVTLSLKDDISDELSDSVTYQWQYLSGVTWINIAGANSNTYTETKTTSNVTYRLMLKDTFNNNTSSYIYSNSYMINIDKTPPSKVIVNLNGYTSGSWTNKDVKQTFSSTDNESGINKYQYSHDNTNWIDVANTWTISWNGNWNFYVRAIDNIGNIGPSSNVYTIKLDKTKPTCATSGGSTTWTKGNRTLLGKCTDTGGSGCTGNSTKTYSTDINTTAANPGTIRDYAGNVTTCSNTTVRIDKTPPTPPSINLNGYASGSWTNGNVKQTYTSIDSGSGLARYEYSHDAKNWATFSNPWTISWEGQWAFYARAIDNVGNISAIPGSYIIRVDKTAPPVPTVDAYVYKQYDYSAGHGNWNTGSPINSGNILDRTIFVQGTASNTDNLSGLKGLYINRGGVETYTPLSGLSNFNPKYVATRVEKSNVDVTYKFRTVDNAGNISAYSSDFRVIVNLQAAIPGTSVGGWGPWPDYATA